MSLSGPLALGSTALGSVVADAKQSLLGSAARPDRSAQGSYVANHTQSSRGADVAPLGHLFGSGNVATGSAMHPTETLQQQAQINPRAVYGLYCSWALAGMMYGFVYNYINIPICQYVFGPMGAPGRSTLAQCTISQTITCMPWNFQVFYGLCLDRVGFLGTRRKGWIIAGWAASLTLLAVIAFVCEHLVKEGALFTYMMLLAVMCMFYIFSTVSSDGMTIEFGKLEPPERRGYIMTTGQMVRFGTQVIINLVGVFGMNDPYYYGGDAKANETVFSFGLSFQAVHIVVLAMCIPVFIAMALLLEDPPKEALHEHHSCRTVVMTLWTIMQTRIMFSLIIFCVMSTAIASLQNPALNVIANISSPSTFQISIGTLVGNSLFLVGVWIFRTYFLNRNWRFTFIWTAVLIATNGCLQLFMIFNTWGIGQSGWFYALGSNILLIVQGVQQVLSSLSVIEISPEGFEASVYEFLVSVGNSGISLNANIMNIFIPIFSLHGIARCYHHVNEHWHNHYNTLLSLSTYFTLLTNIFAALLFCWFLPVGKLQCNEWLGQWRRKVVGLFSLSFGGGVFFFSLIVSLLSAIPNTACLKIAGGSGCASSNATVQVPNINVTCPA